MVKEWAWCGHCERTYRLPQLVRGICQWLNLHWIACKQKATWTPPIPGVEYPCP